MNPPKNTEKMNGKSVTKSSEIIRSKVRHVNEVAARMPTMTYPLSRYALRIRATSGAK